MKSDNIRTDFDRRQDELGGKMDDLISTVNILC